MTSCTALLDIIVQAPVVLDITPPPVVTLDVATVGVQGPAGPQGLAGATGAPGQPGITILPTDTPINGGFF